MVPSLNVNRECYNIFDLERLLQTKLGVDNIPKALQELNARNADITNALSGLDFFVIINDNMYYEQPHKR
jgi:hypothetical protein